MAKVNDLTGKTVAGQYIIAKAPPKRPGDHSKAWWHCRCACGRETVKCTPSLRRAEKGGGIAYCTKGCALLLARAPFTGALGAATRKANEAEPAFLSKLTTQACWTCGREPSSGQPNSVTKRNAGNGWTLGNAIATCKRCMHMRGGLQIADFIAHLKLVLDRHG